MSARGALGVRSARAERRPGAVYAIADVERLGIARVPAAVAAMAEAGIETIQIRAKRATDGELATIVAGCVTALEGWTGELWIDDRADVARLFDLEGVHLGQRDLDARSARAVVGAERSIGVSTHDAAQLASAADDPDADWLAIGPVFPTRSKENPDPVVGLDGVRAARRRTAKPLVAIGGIDEANLAEVFAAGADAAALLSALCDGDVGANARRFVRRAEEIGCGSC